MSLGAPYGSEAITDCFVRWVYSTPHMQQIANATGASEVAIIKQLRNEFKPHKEKFRGPCVRPYTIAVSGPLGLYNFSLPT